MGIAQRARKKQRVKAIHAKIVNRRKDNIHKFTRKLVNTSSAIFVGNVSSQAMVKTKLAKSVLDASWGSIKTVLEYKCAHAGIHFEEVNEAYSQTCPKCGHRHKPSGRNYQCKNPDCDFIGIRDIVGAANIKNKYVNVTIKPNHVLLPDKAKYRRPVKMPVIRPDCVVPLTLGTLLDTTFDMALALSSAEDNTSSELFHAA